jgi:hypothetical protein
VALHPEVGYFERCRCRFIDVGTGEGRGYSLCECDFERGQIVPARGAHRRFSGPPPRDRVGRLDAPEHDEEAGAVLSSLQRFASRWCGRAHLHYSALVARRVTVGTALAAVVRTTSEWSLTGRIDSPSTGRALPLGVSGRGSGLDWIRGTRAGEVRGLVEALDRARPIGPSLGPVVLAPAAAAVIVHEAIGHGAEAATDDRLGGRNPVGRRAASELLSVFDFPLEPGGPVSYEYDDENVRCLGPTPLVEAGVLFSQLHSLATAAAAGALPTANGRAASAWDPPIPRVSNLVCRPGASAPGELIENTGDGLYIHRLANGVNNGGHIEADVVLAEEIRRGRRTGVYLTGGSVREEPGVLRRVVEVGDDAAFHSNALCGKAGQLLFNVGTRSPSLRLSSLRIVT